jgi:hypothetical protein
MSNVLRLFDEGQDFSGSRSRRSSSASMASRMKAAMRFGPTSDSMRRRCSAVRRTFVSFTFSGGRPMRGGVPVPEIFVKVIGKASPLIDRLSVPGYITGDGYEINRGRQMTATEKALEAWNSMSPMQRIEIMRQVPDCKSMTKKFRLCIDFLIKAAA